MRNSFKQIVTSKILLVVFAFTLGFGGAILLSGAIAQNNSEETYVQLTLFGDVFDKVRKFYVEDTKDDKLVESAINGMLTALDPHSSYLNNKAFDDMKAQTRGSFGGLGIEVTMENSLIKVVSPIDDTPAAKAGLKSGDLIVLIDDKPVMGMTLNDAVDKMRGKPGSKVKLTIRRGTQPSFDVTLTRDIITIKSVRSKMLDGKIGYLRVTTFNEQTDDGVNKAIKEFKKKTEGQLVGLVLDLRNNPGGLLDQAVSVSDDFLDRGEIVSTRGRNPADGQRFNAHAGDLVDGVPMVVLINEGSASASEIVAGALQDQHRAILLGMKSFGKGSVQTIIPLPGHGAMRLTTARYYTPSGRSIQAKGIEPDIQVEQAKIEKPADSKIIRESDLEGALKNPDNAKEPTKAPTPKDVKKDKDAKDKDGKEDPEKELDETGLPKDMTTDYQLSRAVDVIKGISLYSKKSGTTNQ